MGEDRGPPGLLRGRPKSRGGAAGSRKGCESGSRPTAGVEIFPNLSGASPLGTSLPGERSCLGGFPKARTRAGRWIQVPGAGLRRCCGPWSSG